MPTKSPHKQPSHTSAPPSPVAVTAADRPIRVAIVGGGCGAMTTAFELTQPGQERRYEVTIYQAGWRLGGKGASGRGPADRIEEHGLHLWMGFYENAFALMRAAYAENARDKRCHIATFEQAFAPAPLVSVVDRVRSSGEWEPWISHFPAVAGTPGDPLDDVMTVRGYMTRAAKLVLELIRSADQRNPQTATVEDPKPEGLMPAIEKLLLYGQLATTAAIYQAADLLRMVVESAMPLAPGPIHLVLRLTEELARACQRELERVMENESARRIWQVIDIVLAVIRGSIRHRLAVDPRGFDAINDYEWREWLRLNGASPQSLECGFVRGIYDLMFGYEDGDVNRPNLAAGVALRGGVRIFFSYRGSMFWRMNAGMGDIVFSPLYEVLKRRGVKFEFFHRLRHVALSEPHAHQTPHATELRFDVQAETKTGEYQPLVDIRGLPCWPSKPDYKQLQHGERLEREKWAFETPWETRRAAEKVLRVGADFDFVVLGIPVAALREVAGELMAREPRWKAMIEQGKTVATQALQLWLKEDVKGLGWKHAEPVNLSGFVTPFDTWADMSHLIPEETWQEPVRSLAYFCSVLPDARGSEDPDAPFQAQQREVVRANAIRFLNKDMPALWPNILDADKTFRQELLVDAAGPNTPREHAIDGQYWTANVAPSERYCQATPGAVRYRLSPLDRSFDNLTIAGDWTQSGLDSGCVESAVMSGMLASHALSSQPPLAKIVGYDHP
jgi:uncharacterized protein with NAD-binding domain and iron-sulfur cluster